MSRSAPASKSWPVVNAAFGLALAAAICSGAPAAAEVRVSGTADALKMEAQGATLEEALRALQMSFQLQYGGTGALNGVVNGTYSGSVPHVVARLLEGRDYVIHASAGGFAVRILGPAGAPKIRAVDA